MEIWKIIPGYEPYQISNLGRLRNKDGVLLKTYINWQGYRRIYFCSLKKNAKIHRLVAYAFLPVVFGKKRINHKSGIKTDNRVENLEWCNDSENMVHAMASGLYSPARGSQLSTLDETQVRTIRKCLEDGLRPSNIARYFKISHASVCDIRTGRSWSWLK